MYETRAVLSGGAEGAASLSPGLCSSGRAVLSTRQPGAVGREAAVESGCGVEVRWGAVLTGEPCLFEFVFLAKKGRLVVRA